MSCSLRVVESVAECVVLGRPWQGSAMAGEMQNVSVRPTGGVSGATAVPVGAAIVGVRKVNLKG